MPRILTITVLWNAAPQLFGRQVPTFRRNLLTASSGQNNHSDTFLIVSVIWGGRVVLLP
jgi:hypothetical protein